jgi:hypothetical protein
VRSALFEAPRTKRRWTGTVALALLDNTVCLRCSGNIEEMVIEEPQMFRSHGYGATRRTTLRRCVDCTFITVAQVQEVRPERARAERRRRP